MADHQTPTTPSVARSKVPATITVERRPRSLGPASTDDRLGPALEAIASGSVSVLTLDVFDTLLWRKVPEPGDAFPLLGATLAEAGRLAPDIDASAFAILRVGAERRARERLAGTGRGEEVTLAEICEQMPPGALRISPFELAEEELELERRLLTADLDVTELARHAKERGLRVAAVSDTYFSEGQLRSLLATGPLEALELDHVFASSDHRVGKGGGLWRLVLDTLGVDGREVVHVGDNHEADVAAAGRAGVHGVYFERRPRELTRVIARENLHAGAPLSPYGDGDGDYGLTALRSKVLHRTEYVGQPSQLRPFWAYGAASLGPPLAGFAEWVHERAAELGASKVFCLMREGTLLAQLVDAAAPAARRPVHAEPVWLSRQVCARASIYDGSADELTALFQRRKMPSVGEFCDTLGIEATAVQGFEGLNETLLSEPHVSARFIHAVTSDADLRARVASHSAELRARLVRYVEGLCPPGENRLLLLDLGWAGTIQTLLDDVLRRSGSAVRTTGLYLMTTERAVSRMLDGTDVHGYLANAGHPQNVVDTFMRSPEILEQICMPDHGSQIDLDADLQPVLAPAEDLPIQAAQRHAVQKGIAAFQRDWVRYRTTCPDDLVPLHDGQGQLRSILLRAVTAPTADEAALFAGWLHDENFGSQGLEPLVTGPSARAARYLDPVALLDSSMTDIYWPFGLAALHDDHLVKAVEAVSSGAVPRDEFSSRLESGDVEIYCDRGWGFRSQGMAKAEGRRNRLGLSHAQGTVLGDVIRRVRIDLAKGPCVLRVDFIRLQCLRRAGGDPVTLDFSTPEQLDKLKMVGMRKIAPGAFTVSGGDPHVIIDLRGLPAPEVFSANVECGFAALPIAAAGLYGRLQPVKDRARERAKRGRLASPLRAAYALLRRLS